jgi:hypothetical protein
VSGLGELQGPGGGEGLGPIPSFSFKAGDRIEVKLANMMEVSRYLVESDFFASEVSDSVRE